MTLRSILIATAIVATPLAAPVAFADKAPVYTGTFSNVAVGGYDPVSYFQETGGEKGDKDFTTTHKGAEFRFTSQANLDAFLADPDAYAPQYGGYCAWAVSQGYTAKGDPKHASVVDGKLYLNYNRKVKEDWLKDTDGFITAADQNWPTVLTK